MINLGRITIRNGDRLLMPNWKERFFTVENEIRPLIPFDSRDGLAILHKTLLTDIIGGKK